MKTLFLSDLDGTLLRSNECVSEYTASIINHLVQNGGCFSYATARSFVTASKVTIGLNTDFPVICYNGAFINKNTTNEILLSNYFTKEEVKFASEVLCKQKIYPIVYAYIDGKEKFTYIERYVTPAMRYFLDSRIGDPRCQKVNDIRELYNGDIFYFTCMDTEDSLALIDKIFKTDDRFNSIYQKDIYSGMQWSELLPIKATKANAALQLKTMLNCDKIIAFGDNLNDIPLFSIADEKYAVFNAVPELKEIATAIIGSNDDDGVGKWIEKNVF